MIVFIINPVEFNEQPDDVIEVANLDQSQDVDIAGTTRRLTTRDALVASREQQIGERFAPFLIQHS